jgi:hypothetical protein
MDRTVVVFDVSVVGGTGGAGRAIEEAIADRWVYGEGGPLHAVEWSAVQNELAIIPSSFRVTLDDLLDMERVIGDAVEDATGGSVEGVTVTTTTEVGYVDPPEAASLDDLPSGMVEPLLEGVLRSPGPVPDEVRDTLYEMMDEDDL